MSNLDQDFESLWSGASEPKGFEPIPKGNYHAEVTGVKYDQGDGVKAPSVNWEVTITDSIKNAQNRKVWQRNQITEKGISFLKENLQILGLSDGISSFDSMLSKLTPAIGLKVQVKVTQREYNGKTYNDFKFDCLIDGSDVPF